MISLKDIVGLEKLAAKLSYPLFGVAVFTSCYGFLSSYISVTPALYISFFVIVPLAAFGAFSMHVFLSDIDIDCFGGRLLVLLGLGLLGFGLLVVGKLAGQEPMFNVSVFWNLWAMSYGFVLLEKPKPVSRNKR